MSLSRHTRRSLFSPLLAGFLATLSLIAVSPAWAEAPPVFVEPPAPEALAHILFGPRFRSVDAAPTGDRFGMTIHFELDSTRLLPQSLPLLDSVGEALVLAPGERRVLVIEGHADARGTHAYNERLSRGRADAIKRYLIESFDIPAARLVTMGLGETQLRDPERPDHAVNRRAEFRAVNAILVD